MLHRVLSHSGGAAHRNNRPEAHCITLFCECSAAKKRTHRLLCWLSGNPCRKEDNWRDGSTLPQATTRELYKKDAAPSVDAPAWDVMEQRILKFYGYFKEHVDESRQENHRVRPCVIIYFLEVRRHYNEEHSTSQALFW